jgi:hypothetical protein
MSYGRNCALTSMKIDNLGAVGINTDLEQHTVPINGFTSGQNVRFSDNYVQKFKGYSQVFGALNHDPYYLASINYLGTHYWVYAGLA